MALDSELECEEERRMHEWKGGFVRKEERSRRPNQNIGGPALAELAAVSFLGFRTGTGRPLVR